MNRLKTTETGLDKKQKLKIEYKSNGDKSVEARQREAEKIINRQALTHQKDEINSVPQAEANRLKIKAQKHKEKKMSTYQKNALQLRKPQIIQN